MISISMKSIKLLTIFCCNMFHDREKFLQQKHLNTADAFFNSLRIKSFYTKRNIFTQKKFIYYLWGKKGL